ncbi:MAG: C45 family autoproteolytic acyltransferase/hydrolase, partial [Actinomycetota bacterium]
ADEIRAYTSERIQLVAAGGWSGGPMGTADVLDIAESMLPAHERFDADLHEEMLAMAESAGITPAEAVIVGGFTDFVDTVRAVAGGSTPVELVEDDCTAVIVPDDRGVHGAGLLAQTWDMHASATDHVVLLRFRPSDAPAVNVFSTTGCLGQIGMNTEGVCVGINNLTGTDGRRGVAWTSVVRGMLRCSTADEALAVLLDADLAGAHNFLIFDRAGAGYDVEAFPTVRPVVALGDEPIVHTNHALHPDASAVQAERALRLNESSTRRLTTAIDLVADGPIDEQRLMALLREPTAICQRATAPLHIESSGAAIMRPATGDFWSCWGRPEENDFHRVAMPIRPPDVIPALPGEPVWAGPSGVRYFRLDARWARLCEELEHQAFPNTSREDLLDVEYVEYLAADFPEGSFVGVDESGVPICVGTGIRTPFDLDDHQHTVNGLIEHNIAEHGGGPSGHVADGDWYYGLTIAVRPDHRRRGIGNELYQLRKQVVRDLGLRGIVAGGVLPGYAGQRLE